MKLIKANRIAPDGTPRSAASHLRLFCLSVSHKRYARLMANRNFNPFSLNRLKSGIQRAIIYFAILDCNLSSCKPYQLSCELFVPSEYGFPLFYPPFNRDITMFEKTPILFFLILTSA